MSDVFADHMPGLESPADRHFAITPADDADVDPTPRALYVNESGTLALRDRAGVTVSYEVSLGQILPFRASRVLAAGTTASVIGWL